MRTEIDLNKSISSVNAFTKRTEIGLRSIQVSSILVWTAPLYYLANTFQLTLNLTVDGAVTTPVTNNSLPQD